MSSLRSPRAPRRTARWRRAGATPSAPGPGSCRRAGSAGPRRPLDPAGRSPPPGQMHLQKLNSQHGVAGKVRRPQEPGSPPGWGLGTQPRGAESHPLQAAGPGIIDSEPVEEEVLGALVPELGLDRADELPELWLGHHEFDFLADLLAGC